MADSELAYYYNLRAQCHHLLREVREAQRWYDASVHADPREPRRQYENRAQYWNSVGQSRLGASAIARPGESLGRKA